MTTTEHAKPVTTQVGPEVKYDSWSTAPNGSVRCHDFYTEVTYRQDWFEGQYAGHSYRIVERYISADPEHRGQYIGQSSQPW